MTKQVIVISDNDQKRLRGLIRSAGRRGPEEKRVVEKLETALRTAVILRSPRIPDDVVTINSCVRLLDVDTGEEQEVWLRFTGEKEASPQVCPVLSELGIALLGNKLGDVVEWPGAAGRRRSKIIEILYQPERLGNYEV